MQITFGKNDGPGGKKGWAVYPTFEFPNWRLTSERADQLSFRPSVKTLGTRLLVTLLFAGLVVGVYFAGLDGRWNGGEVPFAHYVQHGESIAWGIIGLLSALALLAPLSCLWNRMVLRIGPRQDLVVSTWWLFPKSRSYPMAGYASIQVTANEIIHRGRHRQIAEHYWRWSIQMTPAGGEQTAEAPPLIFYPHNQKEHPGPKPRPPQVVKTIVHWLQKNGSLAASGPYVIEQSSQAPRFGRSKATLLHEPQILSGNYESLADMPPEMRQEAERMMVQGAGASPMTQGRRERNVYRSVDEMPPDIRGRFEQMRAQAPHATSAQQFRVRDANGNEQVYHSLEEMPPALRARFEGIRGKDA